MYMRVCDWVDVRVLGSATRFSVAVPLTACVRECRGGAPPSIAACIFESQWEEREDGEKKLRVGMRACEYLTHESTLPVDQNFNELAEKTRPRTPRPGGTGVVLQ